MPKKKKNSEASGLVSASAAVQPDVAAPDRKLDEQDRPGMPGIPESAEQPSPPAEARESGGAISSDWVEPVKLLGPVKFDRKIMNTTGAIDRARAIIAQQAEPKLFNECIECGEKATHLEARCTSHRVGATRRMLNQEQFAENAKFAANEAFPIRECETTCITFSALDKIRQDSFCQGALWSRDQQNHVTKFEYKVVQDERYILAQGSKEYCIGYAEAIESMNWKHLTTVRGKAYRYEVRCDDVVVWSNDSKFTDAV